MPRGQEGPEHFLTKIHLMLHLFGVNENCDLTTRDLWEGGVGTVAVELLE